METTANDQNEILNHCRIHQFLNKATEKLHNIFRNRWKFFNDIQNRSNENEWTPEYGTLLLSLCSGVPPPMAEVIKIGIIDLWDVTLTNLAIQGVSKAIKSHGYTFDKDEEKLISDLREIRNLVAHGKCKLSDSEFLMFSNQLSNILIRTGDSPSDIKAFKKNLMEFGQQKIPEAIDEKSKFNQFKNDANKFYLANKFAEAIDVYNKALEIPGLSPESQALIYSNRSAAYLMVKTPNSLLMAKRDAEWSIQLWPCWWRGYFRLGRAQVELKEWDAAEESLHQALALNPASKEARDELSFIRCKIGSISRHDPLNPDIQPKSMEEMLKELQIRMGISEKQAKDIYKMGLNTPELNDIIKGHQYRDGTGVAQDYEKAVAHFAKAANNNNPGGMYNLALLYKDGKGVKRDFELALYWFKKAANSKPLYNLMKGSGIPEAQHSLGLMYADGIGVKQDLKQAKEWYEKAVTNGYGGSANNLGMMYKNGQGVAKSLSKAFQYFKMAAESGNTPGMQNLALSYFNAEGTGSTIPTENDIAEGKKWLRFAASKGDLMAAKMLEERENLSQTDYTISSLMKLFSTDPSLKSNPLDQEKFGKAVKEAAKKGSKTAQQLLEIWNNLNAALEAFKRNDSAGVCAGLAKAIRLDHQIVTIPELLRKVVEERYKTHPNDLDAVTCFIQLNSKNMRFDIVLDKIANFPNDEFLLEIGICGFIVLKDINEAFKLADISLKQFPNSLRLLFIRAVALTLKDNQTEETIKTFDKFLAIAPSDHDKVPACHYRKAQYYILKQDNPKFIKCYEAGLESEKRQLPCFLPYQFPLKNTLEKMYEIHKNGGKKPGDVGPTVVNPSPIQTNMDHIFSNPKRKLLLTRHRDAFINIETNSNKYDINLTIKNPPNIPPRPKLANLKPIFLKDMDPTKDKVYEGFVLEARIIDWILTMSSVAIVIEDGNGDVERMAVYNWPKMDNKIECMKTFRPNTMISIINPYLRQAADGQIAIRVESPAFITLDNSSTENRCYCCGKEAKTMQCSICLMASYCSKECQKFDWIQFNHKDVCKHLKKYSTAVNS